MSSRFKFKAWDKERNLLIRPGNVDFKKGELVIPNCVMLQFTGFIDELGQEIYEEDILLIGDIKYHVFWDTGEQTWKYKLNSRIIKLSQSFAEKTVIGYNAYERGENE
jgi:hypothetical protein